MSYVIRSKGGSVNLEGIEFGSFCSGKSCIRKNNNNYICFSTKKEGEKYIERNLEYLDEWINIEIPQQAESWYDKKEQFLKESQDKFYEIKKSLVNLEVVNQ